MIAIIQPLFHLGGISITPDNMQDLLEHDGIYLALTADNREICRGTWKYVFQFCIKYKYNNFQFR